MFKIILVILLSQFEFHVYTDLFKINLINKIEKTCICVPLKLTNGNNSGFLLFPYHGDSIVVMDSSFNTIKTIFLGHKLDIEPKDIVKKTYNDKKRYSNIMVISQSDKKFYLIDQNLKLYTFDLKNLLATDKKILYVYSQNKELRGAKIMVFVGDSTSTEIYSLYLNGSVRLINRYPLKFVSVAESDQCIYYVLKDTDAYVIFKIDHLQHIEKKYEIQVESITDLYPLNVGILLFKKKDGKKYVIELLSYNNDESQILLELKASKINKIIPINFKKGSFMVIYDDHYFFVYYKGYIFKYVLPHVITDIVSLPNVLGENSIGFMVKFQNFRGYFLYDFLGKKIAEFPNCNSLYDFDSYGTQGLVVNTPESTGVVKLELNVALLKKKLFLAAIFFSGMMLIPIILYLAVRADFEIFIHRAFLEHSDDLVLVIDKHHLVRHMNEGMKRFLLSYISPNSHFKVKVKYLFEDVRLKEVLESIYAATTENKEVEKLIEVGDKKKTLFLLRVIPLTKHKSTGAFLIIMKDLTEIVERRRIIAWAQLARNILHEIKNPLSSILIAQERIKRKLKSNNALDTKDIENYLYIIKSESERINHHLKNLMKLYLKKHLELQPHDLCESIMHVIEIFKRNNPDIAYEVTCLGRAVFPVDRELFELAISNIISNSIEAISNKRGIVKVLLLQEKDSINISIKDNGEGMSEDELTKIFEPGYTTKSTGFGLGLSIAKEIVESFGGDIIVKSKKFEGTEVTIKFNLCEVNHDQRREDISR